MSNNSMSPRRIWKIYCISCPGSLIHTHTHVRAHMILLTTGTATATEKFFKYISYRQNDQTFDRIVQFDSFVPGLFGLFVWCLFSVDDFTTRDDDELSHTSIASVVVVIRQSAKPAEPDSFEPNLWNGRRILSRKLTGETYACEIFSEDNMVFGER